MTPLTIIGRAGGIGVTASHYSRSGRLTDAHFYRDLELELPDDVPIDIDHDDANRVGTIIFGEVSRDGGLHLVGVLDDDRIAEVPHDVFLSAKLEMRGSPEQLSGTTYTARTASLLAAAVTLNPATHGAWPITLLRGDLRSTPDRWSWPVSWRWSHPLLARALDHLDTLHLRSAPRLVDQRDDGPHMTEHGWVDHHGRAIGRGRLHYSQPYAGIISVR